ncbi:unnamed protein product [Angiostrongylus costaricensis]|uniref:PH domain-containing protein n=1 Tax=Angiostrongylus costaricensis TaxID=334426 RepID=A0A0R3PBU3_ANGCS|nr:unnamed protein product [Angiostrongylus costaricensis]
MFVASVELGEVLIDRPSYINDNRIYMTYAKFVLDCTHPPYGHFVSTGLIESVHPQYQVEAMMILRNRKERERQDDCADLDVPIQKKCTTAICIDVYPSGSEFIVECYSIKNRELYKFRTEHKELRQTWELATACIMKAIVAKYSGRSISVEFYQVLNVVQLIGTEFTGHMVCLDSDADSTDINFQICGLLKPVTDEQTIRRCQKQLLKEEDELYQLHQRKLIAEQYSAYEKLGQPSFVQVLPCPRDLIRGNGMCADPNQVPKLTHKKRLSTYMSMGSERQLMLVTKVAKNMSEAWSRIHGRVMLPDLRVRENGIFLRRGHWFYGAISFSNLCPNGEPIFRVKKVECLSEPLAYTKIELEVDGAPVKVLKEESNIIIENDSVGKIKMSLDEYSRISESRKSLVDDKGNTTRPELLKCAPDVIDSSIIGLVLNPSINTRLNE